MPSSRPLWRIVAPAGVWGPPWPQVAELAQSVPPNEWTLVGGLMVQVHVLNARLPVMRPTVDIDMLLHLETGATTFNAVQHGLEDLGYTLVTPLGRKSPVHRFVRENDQIDVMVADNLAPSHRPTIRGRPVFAVPAGTSALKRQ